MWRRMVNEVVVARQQYLRGICLCVLKATTKSEQSRCAGLGSKAAFPEYKSFVTLIWSIICLKEKGVLQGGFDIRNGILVSYQSSCSPVVAETDKKCPALCGTRRAHPPFFPRGTPTTFLGGKAAGA